MCEVSGVVRQVEADVELWVEGDERSSNEAWMLEEVPSHQVLAVSDTGGKALGRSEEESRALDSSSREYIVSSRCAEVDTRQGPKSQSETKSA